jgi:phospholipid/cholesterol/gamma-HCH transport system permease protein
VIAATTTRIRDSLAEVGNLALLAREVLRSVFSGKISARDLTYQLYFIGVKSQSVVFITGAFTGMVLCAQTYFQFHKVRMDTATLAVVSVSMCSELGPVLTALMVAGRVGAALAAELGTMRVTEQIDALRTLATHPVDYLIVPRFLATTIAMPVLTAAAISIGIGAGYLIGVYYLDIDPTYAWANMMRYTFTSHVLTGLIKSAIYGAQIAIISCYKGMNCGEGAEGVGPRHDRGRRVFVDHHFDQQLFPHALFEQRAATGMIEARELTKSFGRAGCARWRQPADRERRIGGDHRAQRRRQERSAETPRWFNQARFGRCADR